MKTNSSISLMAIAAVLGSASLVMAADTNSFDASVSVLSPDQTGFIIGGQVAVNGVGSGALTMTRSLAQMSLTGGALSELGTGTVDGTTSGANADSFVKSALSFDRTITTSGALVGIGSVTSRGEAIALLGSAGAASGSTETAGTRELGALGSTDDGGAGSATANSSAQGSLNGSLSTTNTLQLLGTSGLFAGTNGASVGEQNHALAYGSSGVFSDGVTGVDLTKAKLTAGSDTALPDAEFNGALFDVRSSLKSGVNVVDPDTDVASTVAGIGMSVSNAGNGLVSISTSTGGFFTGGGAAAGAGTFADTKSFFSDRVQP